MRVVGCRFLLPNRIFRVTSLYAGITCLLDTSVGIETQVDG